MVTLKGTTLRVKVIAYGAAARVPFEHALSMSNYRRLSKPRRRRDRCARRSPWRGIPVALGLLIIAACSDSQPADVPPAPDTAEAAASARTIGGAVFVLRGGDEPAAGPFVSLPRICPDTLPPRSRDSLRLVLGGGSREASSFNAPTEHDYGRSVIVSTANAPFAGPRGIPFGSDDSSSALSQQIRAGFKSSPSLRGTSVLVYPGFQSQTCARLVPEGA